MKYLVMWEWDSSKMPAEPAERMAMLQKVMGITKQYFVEHPGEGWGAFPGENRGYWLGATKWQDIARINQTFAPYFKIQVHQAVSLVGFEEFFKSLMPGK